MEEDQRNKALVERVTAQFKRMGMDAFIFDWEGTRVPDTIKFPDGSEKPVNYMRDGMLFFKDRTSAVYERLDDIFPRQPQSVLVGYIPPKKL